MFSRVFTKALAIAGLTVTTVPIWALLSDVETNFQFPFSEKMPPEVFVGKFLIVSQALKITRELIKMLRKFIFFILYV